MKTKKVAVIVLVALIALSLTACYINRQVETSEVGIQMNDGVTIAQVVGAGRYTKMNLFADLVIIDVSSKTATWQDPDLVTKDKQPIGLEIVVTYQRMRDKESIEGMWSNYRAESTDDIALQNQVISRVPGVAKDVTTGFTLDQMLGILAANTEDEIADPAGRQELTNQIFKKLQPELTEIYVQLLDVRIVNISPDPQYLALLSQKAQAQVEKEVAAERTALLGEQLKQEKAQTNIELEKANRQNQVNAVLAEAYEDSPELFELRKLELLGQIFGEGDTFMFIPEGSDLSVITTSEGNVVPVD